MRVDTTQTNLLVLLASTSRTKRILILSVLLGVALFFVSSMMTALPAQASTTITVNTTEDEDNADGDCSLREAIHATNTNAPRDACPAGSGGANDIDFDLGSSPTITLGSTLPRIYDGYTVIDGEAPGADVTVSGNDQVRVFYIDAPHTILRNLTITRGNVDDSTAPYGGLGGAIVIYAGRLELGNVTISNSKAQHGGGAIRGVLSGEVLVTDSTFSGNHAGEGGALMFPHDRHSLEVRNSTFTNNSAVFGGAILAKYSHVVNSTFAHNGAHYGGAIYGVAPGGVDVYNSTFFNNDQYSGSQVLGSSIAGGVDLADSLISESDAQACDEGGFSATVRDHGYNIETGDSCGFSEAMQSMSNADAGLDPLGLQDNGGPTQTIALQPTSPAIDFHPLGCTQEFFAEGAVTGPGGTLAPITEDQRGSPRIQGGGCDAGAFEAPADVTPPAAPTIASPAQGSLNAGSFTISGTADVNTTVELFEGSNSLGTGRTNLSGEWSIDLTDIPEGSHTYIAKATDRAGNTSNESGARTLTVDLTAPVVAKAPVPNLLLGSQLGTNAIPVTLEWSATDALSGVARYEVQRSTNGDPYVDVTLPSATSTTLTHSLTPASTYQYRVRAQDQAGNWSSWELGQSYRVEERQENYQAVTYTGKWTLQALSTASDGYVRYASASGAKAKFVFAGRSVAWIAPTGPDRGKAEVWIDGAKVATVDLYSSTNEARKMVFTKSWSTSDSHTLEIRVLGTKKAPSSGKRVDVDAFVALR